MNILYHHRTLGDGAEGIHIASMVQAFRELGHTVNVAAVIGEETNVPTTRTRLLGYLTRPLPRAAYEAMELGYSIAGHRMLSQHIKRWAPDFIYERYALFNFAGIMTARQAGIPLVLEVNAPLAYERAAYERLSLRRIARRCEQIACQRADLVAVVSTPLKQYLIDQGVAAEQIIVLPNGVEPHVFQPDAEARQTVRARLGIPDQALVIGFAGILRPWHGVELLIEALAQIQKQIKNQSGQSGLGALHMPHVIIVGDGPSQAQLEQQSQANGLQQLITFVGRVPHADIPAYLAATDIGVSSRAAFYASPMKILEYMACGLAVVAPRMPNVQDLVTEGVDGLLFELEKSDDLAAVLLSLIQHPEQCQSLGQRARATILKTRTWQRNADQIIKLMTQKPN